MLKNLYAGCLGLSLAVSAQFTLKMYVAARNHKKFMKTPYFGGSRSFKVINVIKLESTSPFTSACYDVQHVCTYLQLFSH